MNANRIIEQFYINNYKKYVKRIFNKCKNMSDAEDVVQETFCRALKMWCEPRDINAWMGVILENAYKDHMRAERRSGCSDHDELDEGHITFDMSDWAEDMMKKLNKEVANVKDENHRTVLFLYYIRGFKPREILDVVPLKAGNVRIIIHRFAEEFRHKYEGDKRI